MLHSASSGPSHTVSSGLRCGRVWKAIPIVLRTIQPWWFASVRLQRHRRFAVAVIQQQERPDRIGPVLECSRRARCNIPWPMASRSKQAGGYLQRCAIQEQNVASHVYAAAHNADGLSPSPDLAISATKSAINSGSDAIPVGVSRCAAKLGGG